MKKKKLIKMNNLEKIKLLANLTTDEHDEFIQSYFSICLEWIKAYCNNDFKNEVPQAVYLFIAKAVRLNMVPIELNSRSMGTVSYKYNTEYPDSMLSLLTPYRRVKFHVI